MYSHVYRESCSQERTVHVSLGQNQEKSWKSQSNHLAMKSAMSLRMTWIFFLWRILKNLIVLKKLLGRMQTYSRSLWVVPKWFTKTTPIIVVILIYVSRIGLLGKRYLKNSAADYVRRVWSTIFADSLSKEVNWLGRRDKRVNNGLGKRELVLVSSRSQGLVNKLCFYSI